WRRSGLGRRMEVEHACLVAERKYCGYWSLRGSRQNQFFQRRFAGRSAASLQRRPGSQGESRHRLARRGADRRTRAKRLGSCGGCPQRWQAKAKESNGTEEKVITMTLAAHATPGARNRLLAGYVLTTLVALFLTFDTVIKVLRLAPAIQGTTALGYPAG